MLSRISTSILWSARRTVKDIVNSVWSVTIVTFALMHCWYNQLLISSVFLDLISFALSTTSLSNLLGLLMSHCTNNFNHSGLDDSGPLIGGVIPKTVSRIDLILSFVNPLLLVSFCSRPSFCPKLEVQHDRRGRGMPTLTTRREKIWCCSCIKKEIMRLRKGSTKRIVDRAYEVMISPVTIPRLWLRNNIITFYPVLIPR